MTDTGQDEFTPAQMKRVYNILHEGNTFVMIVPGSGEKQIYMAIEEGEQSVATTMTALIQTLSNLSGCIVTLLDPDSNRILKTHTPNKSKVHFVRPSGEKSSCDHG